MANTKAKKAKIKVKVDDTLDDVLELIEGLEEVELSFVDGAFFELPEDVLEKLDKFSLIKYGQAEAGAKTTERFEKKVKERGYRRLELNQGSAVERKMRTPKDDDKYHYAILDGTDYEEALKAGYFPFDEDDAENNVVRTTNKITKEEEELVKLKIPKERYVEHMKAVSDDSRKMIRNHVGSAGPNSEIEIKKDKQPIGIFENGNEEAGK